VFWRTEERFILFFANQARIRVYKRRKKESTLSVFTTRHDRGRLKRPAREENTREVQRGRYHRGFEKISRGANRNETGENTVRRYKFVSKFVQIRRRRRLLVFLLLVVKLARAFDDSLVNAFSQKRVYFYMRVFTYLMRKCVCTHSLARALFVFVFMFLPRRFLARSKRRKKKL